MKKLLRILSVTILSMALLTGCSAGFPFAKKPTKEDAVQAAKANIEGMLKGNKSEYDAYYGNGKYDEHLAKALKENNVIGTSSQFSDPEKAKEMVDIMQSLLKKVNVEYEAKSEKEVMLHIHSMAFNNTQLQEWMVNEITSGKLTEEITQNQDKMTLYMFKAMQSGDISLSETKVVDQLLTLKEVNGKLDIESPDANVITQLMFTEESKTATV